MTDYNPPIENLPIFDSAMFTTGDEYITQNKADKRYLRYPNAQGKETLQAVDVNGLANIYNTLTIAPNSTSLQKLIYDPATMTLTITDGASVFNTISNVGIRHTATTSNSDFYLTFSSSSTTGIAVVRKASTLICNPSTGLLASNILRAPTLNIIDTTNSPQTLTQLKSTSNAFVIDQANQKNSSISIIPYDINAQARQYKFNYNELDLGASNITNAFSITANDAFYGDLQGNASSSSSSYIGENNTNNTFYPIFTNNTGTAQTLIIDKTTGPLSYNPSTGTLTATTFNGTVTNATNALNATNIFVSTDPQIVNCPMVFSTNPNTGYTSLYQETNDFYYTPTTNTLNATNFNGLASNATNAVNATNVYITNDDGLTGYCPLIFNTQSISSNTSLYQDPSNIFYDTSYNTLYSPSVYCGISIGTTYNCTARKYLFLDSNYDVPVQTRNLFDNHCIEKYVERFSKNIITTATTTGNITFDLYWYAKNPPTRTSSIQSITTYNVSSTGVTFAPAVSRYINGNNLLIQSRNQPGYYTTLANNGIQYAHTQSTMTYEVCFYTEHTSSNNFSGIKVGLGQSLNTGIGGNYDINQSVSQFSCYLANNVNGNYNFYVNGMSLAYPDVTAGIVKSKWMIFKITFLSSTQIKFDLRGLFSGSGVEYTYTHTMPSAILPMTLYSSISLNETSTVNTAYLLVNKITYTYAQQNINNI